MADGRHLEKLKTAISPQRFDRSAQNLAGWRILAPRRVRAVKISNFWKSKMADGRHLENRKTAISPQRHDRSAQNLAQCRILTLWRVWASEWAQGFSANECVKQRCHPYRLVPKCLIWNDTKWHKCLQTALFHWIQPLMNWINLWLWNTFRTKHI